MNILKFGTYCTSAILFLAILNCPLM